VSEDPFLALGLPPTAGLTDDDVRAAWRRIAAATHPDRDDGGDPARFGAAAAAYALLRTAYGRGEALADLDSRARRDRRRSRASPGIRPGRPGVLALRGNCRGRLRVLALRGTGRGRPGVLAVRVLVAVAIGALALAAAGWTPATIGVLAGALTWLAATARHDLPRRTRQ
jgi:curved DNA-binding protein CbpA